MPDGDIPLLEVARIDKPHGLQGEVTVSLISNVEERLAPGSVLQSERGPMAVLASRRHQHRWIVTFDRVSTREDAEAARGLVLLAEAATEVDDDAMWAHQVIGADVVEADGTRRGRVVAMIDNPASDLLELDSGALVPLTFVTGWDGEGRLRIDPPPGLFDDLPGDS